jgi:prepilin-type processing-associated H-X9-DG protein
MVPFEPNAGGSASNPNVGWPVLFLPHIEQDNLFQQLAVNSAGLVTNPGAAAPVKTFICPSRRTTANGARIDYCGAYNGGISEADITNFVGGSNANKSILNTQGITLAVVTGQAGSSNTLLLSHKIMRPAHYQGGSGTDPGWVFTHTFDHMRWGDTFAGGSNAHRGYFHDDNSVDENHMGGPHPGGSPVLWADGGVRMFSYGYTDGGLTDDATWQALWAYNRTNVVNTP